MLLLFPAAPTPTVPIHGRTERFPVHRIYCVGRNYAAHAREMGMPVERGTPTFFCKPADAIVTEDRDVPYPPGTTDLHHEVEFVFALHQGGHDIAPERAHEHIFGYAIGLDLTRRDLQAMSKAKGLPWDTAKAFDHSAPISSIVSAEDMGHPQRGEIWLEVNGQQRQRACISGMLFDVPAIVAELSKLFELKPGDLIYTGTPEGVAALQRGDRFRAGFGDVASCNGRMV